MILWSEWQQWTATDDAEVLDYRMAECLNNQKVREFMAALTDYLTYCRVQETGRHLEDPARKPRTYSEAMREMQQKLMDIKNLHERDDYNAGNSISGIRRRSRSA